MPKTLYLIGHGRVDSDETVTATIPGNVTMYWGAALGNVTAGISLAVLSGKLDRVYGTDGPGNTIPQHYLCGDVELEHNKKIDAFFNNPAVGGNPYVLFPRKKESSFTLTSIFEYLNSIAFNDEWNVYWTCCRGYIGKANPIKSQYDRKSGTVVDVQRVNPPETPKPEANATCTFENSILVAKSDWEALKSKPGRLGAKAAKFQLDTADTYVENWLKVDAAAS